MSDSKQIEWLKARLADLQLPPTKRDHDTREKWLLQCGMPSAALPTASSKVTEAMVEAAHKILNKSWWFEHWGDDVPREAVHHALTAALVQAPVQVGEIGVKALQGIYIASKTKHADRWRRLRAAGFPIISTWIDEAGQGESVDLSDLWRRCILEASTASVLILYREPEDVLKGGWVELGAALACGVPVLAVGIEEFTIAKDERIRHFKGLDAAIAYAVELVEEHSALALPLPVQESAPVAWMHPTANWSHVNYQAIRIHCRNDGPMPIPLYLHPETASVREGWRLIGYIGKSSLALLQAGELSGCALTADPPKVESVPLYADPSIPEEKGGTAESVKPISLETLRGYFKAMDAGDVPDQALALYSYLLMDGFISRRMSK